MCPHHIHKFHLKYSAAIILLIALPLILSITLSTVLLSTLLLRDLDDQANSFGQTTADLLADSSEEYLLSSDLLSLNVLLSELVSKDYFNHASIYSADNHLLAEAGTLDSAGDRIYTAEIHYQDSIAGHLRIRLAQTARRKASAATITIIIISNLFLLAVVALLVHKSGERISAFLNRLYDQNTSTETDDIVLVDTEKQISAENSITACRFSILVIKLKPARVAQQFKHAINQAISLYNGGIMQQKDDEVAAIFAADSDHCFQAICTTLVLQSLADDLSPGLKLSAGIHCGRDLDEQDAIMKHAIYLASLESVDLLTSQDVNCHGQIRNRVKISEFHSSLAPDSKVFAIESLQDGYQTLIKQQAMQLNQSR